MAKTKDQFYFVLIFFNFYTHYMTLVHSFKKKNLEYIKVFIFLISKSGHHILLFQRFYEFT